MTGGALQPTEVRPGSRVRVESVDVLRGCVMILMALDHVRDYFGAAGVDPTNPATASGALFFTRWITHFCAPVFFLLTGTGAFLASQRRTTAGISRLLLTRGLWLIALEVTVMRFALQFNVDYRVTVLTVLWAIGWSMVVLSGLVWLPTGLMTAVAFVVIAGHNLLDFFPATALGRAGAVVSVLHSPAVLYTDGAHVLFSAYPLIPWVAVVAAGYGFGQVFLWEPERRRAFLLRVGAALTVAFVLLRTLNVYGDPRPWTGQASGFHTVLSFLNANKYPPSLLFLLMTLGPALMFLGAIEHRRPRLFAPALVIGRVPFFYYVLHFFFMHFVAVVVCYARYGAVHWMFESPGLGQYPVTQPPGWPFTLPWVYFFWALVVVTLYPLCRWFAGVKQRRSDWWLSYL